MTRLGIIPVLVALTACNEPPRPEATFRMSFADASGVQHVEEFTAGFALLSPCEGVQILQVNSTGLARQANAMVLIDGDRARLQSAYAQGVGASGAARFNIFFEDAPLAPLERRELPDDWVELRFAGTGKTKGSWLPDARYYPDALTFGLQGRFRQIAEYGVGGMRSCAQGPRKFAPTRMHG